MPGMPIAQGEGRTSCVNCGKEAEARYTVILSNEDRVENVPLCVDCYDLTDTEQ